MTFMSQISAAILTPVNKVSHNWKQAITFLPNTRIQSFGGKNGLPFGLFKDFIVKMAKDSKN